LISKDLTCISKPTLAPPTDLIITDGSSNNNSVLIASGSSFISIYTLNYDKTNNSTNLELLLTIPQATALVSTANIVLSNLLKVYALTFFSS